MMLRASLFPIPFMSDLQPRSSTSDSDPDSSPLPLPPPSLPTPWNGAWTTLWVIGALLLFIAGQLIGTAVLGKVFSAPGESLQEVATDGDIIGTVAFFSLFLVCPFCLFVGDIRKPWSGFSYLGNARFRWWHLFFWFGALLLTLLVFSTLIAPYLGVTEEPESMKAIAESTQYPILVILGVTIGAPLVEEFIFRGVAWRGWTETWLGVPGTILLTSLLWTALHVQYDFIRLGLLFALGIIFGLARHFTGNLWVPVAMHALNNAIACLVMFYPMES